MKCPSCGETKHLERNRDKESQVRNICLTCGAVFANPLASLKRRLEDNLKKRGIRP